MLCRNSLKAVKSNPSFVAGLKRRTPPASSLKPAAEQSPAVASAQQDTRPPLPAEPAVPAVPKGSATSPSKVPPWLNPSAGTSLDSKKEPQPADSAPAAKRASWLPPGAQIALASKQELLPEGSAGTANPLPLGPSPGRAPPSDQDATPAALKAGSAEPPWAQANGSAQDNAPVRTVPTPAALDGRNERSLSPDSGSGASSSSSSSRSSSQSPSPSRSSSRSRYAFSACMTTLSGLSTAVLVLVLAVRRFISQSTLTAEIYQGPRCQVP